jgi:ABC-type multidrug transport system fused ATPase/permease subunit
MGKFFATNFRDAWFLSRFFFEWMDPFVFKLRFNSKTDPSEYLQLDDRDTVEGAKSKFEVQWAKQARSRRPSLLMVLLRCYLWDFIVSGLWKLFWSFLICLAAFYYVLNLVKFVGSPTMPVWYGWVLCISFFLASVLIGIAYQQFQSRATQVGVRMRAALLTSVYEKAMRLDLQDLNAGDVVNLATNDCSRLMDAVVHCHLLWTSAVESATIIALLIYLVGTPGYIALGVIVIMLFVQIAIGFGVAALRDRNINTTDERVSLMTEILLAIKLVKLYAWENFFAKHVKTIRLRELKLMYAGAAVKTINLMIVFGVPPLIGVLLFSTYVLTVGNITASVQATTLSLFNTLRFPLVILPRSLRAFAEFVAALKRLQAFLLQDEMEGVVRDEQYKGIKCEDATFAYKDTATLLHDINFEIPEGTLCGLLGQVGTGKSNLINALLGQMHVKKGSYLIGNRIAYVPQTPWIQNGTIRENICFGREYDQKRYDEVVYACCLVRDFEIMPDGDATVLSDRGQNLSGGQKQRLALARACYQEADIFLLDSPLSAVDQHTCIHIFDNCIRGFLKGKTILLITHHLELLQECDFVSVMNDGKMTYYGEFNALCVKSVKEFFPNWPFDDDALAKFERRKNAKLVESPSFSTLVELEPSPKDEISIIETQYPAVVVEVPTETVSIDNVQVEEVVKEDAENKAPTSTQSEIKKYLKESFEVIAGHWIFSKWCNPFFLMFCICIAGITQADRIVSDRWAGWWTTNAYGFPNQAMWIWTYTIFVVAFCVLCFVRGLFFFLMTLRASTRLHNKMFKAVLQAPMLFFNNTPVGQVLNCFSKDQDCADESLPDVIHMTMIYLMILLTTVIIVCISLPYYTIVIAVLAISFIIMYLLYAPAAAKLKEESGVTNASIFAHLNESLSGVMVLRAFSQERRFTALNADKIDSAHRVMFNNDQLNLWLSFRLDFVSAVLVFATAIFAVVQRGSLDAATFGVAISNSFQQLVFYTWVVRGMAEINQQIACMQRMDSYVHVEQEAPAHIAEHTPSDEWPTKGVVELENLALRYAPNLPLALNHITISINSGEKVGVVGRTGSGKTTLLMSLFRLIEPEVGSKIRIDGIDVMQMGLADLRSRVAIIPQEPVMFKGTIRSNLDPFDKYNDEELWEALECANLKDSVKSSDLQLETIVLENGSNFSLGQKQLFCLARAVLNRSRLLVFDEATAAMDLETDAQIQATIRRIFADRTILTIAHRLDTIIDSDRILVMDNGNVLEFDSPAKLLRDSNSSFSKLVDQTGPDSAQALRAIAFGHHGKEESARSPMEPVHSHRLRLE